ncbi:MAG TPA: hypothetical protein VN668_01705 [Stellaceae bacterium]|nr:hypothetical protein [Stellaceae bacterium]
MALRKLGDERRSDGIDLDRVIVDPDYRRRVIDRLRSEAATRLPAENPATSPSASETGD